MPESLALRTGPVDAPGRYRVDSSALDAVVAGGEGLVYRALDVDRGVTVALKLLSDVAVVEFGRLAERSAPFAAIRHPHLMSHVEVFVGTALTTDPSPHPEDFDVVFSVAEWIEGTPLPDLVDDLDTVTRLRHVADLARALDALHRFRSPDAPHGIVHRDVKPSNVRIDTDGRAVLIDFGVARPLDDDLTQGVGTYRWRAPEVLSGSAPIGVGVDVWGIGALGFWMLTGRSPGLDGEASAREALVHAARARDLGDPAGVAGHVAQLLATDPARRPGDLGRWAQQLDGIVAGRRRTWRRPVAVAALAAVTLPIGLLMVTSPDDEPGPSSTSVGTAGRGGDDTATPSAAGAPTGLVASVGDVWEVDCLGYPSSMIVTGAEPNKTLRLEVEYAPDATPLIDRSIRPVSRATGFDGSTGPALPPGAIRLGDPELRADSTGSLVVEWHCARPEVGIPMILTVVNFGRSRVAVVRVESRDDVVGLDLTIGANATIVDADREVVVDNQYRLDVAPRLTERGAGAVSRHGSATTGRNFDPRLVVTSSDPVVASVAVAGDGSWRLSANAPGTTLIEARIPDTPHVVSSTVRVVEPPAPPAMVGDRFEPGSIGAYLAAVLDTASATELELTTDARGGTAPALRDACDDLDGFERAGWLDAQLLSVEPLDDELGGVTVQVHTFVDDRAAAAWTDALRSDLARHGRSCPLLWGLSGVLRDDDPARFSIDLPDVARVVRVTRARNVVVAVDADADRAARVQRAIDTALSLPA